MLISIGGILFVEVGLRLQKIINCIVDPDIGLNRHTVLNCWIYTNEIFYDIILSCKIVDSDWLRDIWKKSISPTESWNHALTSDRTWQRVILLDNGWYSKKYQLRRIYSRMIHHRFWLHGVVWACEFTEYKIQTQIFTWPGLFWNQT